MFKVFRYLFLVTLYKKAKKSFIILFLSIVTLPLISFMINDFINISKSSDLYMLIVLKWAIIISLIFLILYNIIKIINITINPFKDEQTSLKEKKQEFEKTYILEKKKLFTKSDNIINKYIKLKKRIK